MSHPIPTNFILALVYSTYDFGWYRDHYGAKLIDSIGRMIWLRFFSRIPGQSLLDFGGGLGYLSRAARLFRYKSITIDPVLTPNQGTFVRFDIVFLSHVLEHSNDLPQTLCEIRALLNPKGHAIFAVPNKAGRGYRKRGANWVWAQPPLVHIYHFTAQGLSELLENNGFSVKKIEFKERWDSNLVSDLFLAKWIKKCDRLYFRTKHKKFAASFSTVIRFLSLAIANILRFFVKKNELSELLVVAQKRMD
jgi:predicted SAM-dependent methyltransferase